MLACVCVFVPKGKLAHAVKTTERTSDLRWGPRRHDTSNGVKASLSLRSLHLLHKHSQRCSHTHFSGLSGGKSHAYSSSPSYFTCHSQFITHLCAHTHTHSQNQQQRPLMSRNAHRSVKQHDSCRSRGPPSLVGCCPQPTVPPNQTMARPAFPATGVLILYSDGLEKRTTGRMEPGGGGRQEGKAKHFLLFSPDYFCCLTLKC